MKYNVYRVILFHFFPKTMDEYNNAKNQRRRNLHNKKQHYKPHSRHHQSNPSNSKDEPFVVQQRSLKQVYFNTQKIFREAKLTSPKSTLYNINRIDLDLTDKTIEQESSIEVKNIDTFDLASEYASEGLNVMVLNMASDYKPGGGVVSGKTAQEECLFRRSNAFMTHPRKWYPLEVYQVVYSPEVQVIKDSKYELLTEKDQFKVGMIAIPALRKPHLVYGEYYSSDRMIMQNKIESIFKIAIEQGHDSLVLGALGCGIFRNPPTEVANIFKTMIREYGKYFKKIGFAILVVKASDQKNVNTFSKLLLHGKNVKK